MEEMIATTKSIDYPNKDKYEGRKINWVNIDMADNGFIVTWSEMEEKEKSSMEHCESINHKKLFSEKEDESAWNLFKELKMLEMSYSKKKKGGMY